MIFYLDLLSKQKNGCLLHETRNISDAATSISLTGSDGTAEVGDTVVLTCTSTGGYPSPVVSIEQGGSAEASGSSPQYLSINIVEGHDGATYECKAVNSVGPVSTSITFDVSCEYKMCVQCWLVFCDPFFRNGYEPYRCQIFIAVK